MHNYELQVRGFESLFFRTYHSSKIKNGERVMDFYNNNNLLISLHNVW